MAEEQAAVQDNTETALTPENIAGVVDEKSEEVAGVQQEVQKEAGKTAPPAKEEAKESADPVEYTEFKLPEGVVIDEEGMKEFLPWAKELKMTQEQAQKALDLHAAILQKTFNGFVQQREINYTDVMSQVKAEDGPKFAENVGKINAFFKQFGCDPAIVHQAVAQIAANSPEKAKELYRGLNKAATQAFFSGDFFRANQTTKEPVRYPGIPGKR